MFFSIIFSQPLFSCHSGTPFTMPSSLLNQTMSWAFILTFLLKSQFRSEGMQQHSFTALSRWREETFNILGLWLASYLFLDSWYFWSKKNTQYLVLNMSVSLSSLFFNLEKIWIFCGKFIAYRLAFTFSFFILHDCTIIIRKNPLDMVPYVVFLLFFI